MIKIAIDMGSSTTKIYRIGSGIVLSEASCVAINIETGKIKAIGDAAKQLFGKTAEFTAINFPVINGEVQDEKLAAAMLKYFIEKTEIKQSQLSSVHAVLCVPCGIKSENCSKYYRVADACGIGKISFVEAPFLSATGMNAPVSDINPVFSIDIGGGVTNIAVVSYDGIIAGISMGYGGIDIDKGIADYLAKTKSLKIGPLTSERLKNEVGSLIEGDGKRKVVNGRNLDTGKPTSESVSSQDIEFIVRDRIEVILKYVEMILMKIPAEVSASICRSGIYLSGGVSAMPGLKEYIESEFKVEVHVGEESTMAVVLGGGKIAEDAAILKKVRICY